MWFRKDYLEKLAAELQITQGELLGKIRELHPEKSFMDVFVVADEEDRYVAIATYEVDYTYRGHPPSLTYAIYKVDSRVEVIDRAGYGLGIK